MPYGYYTVLRWSVCLTGIALAISFPRTGHWGVGITAAAVAMLFNPFVPVAMERDAWKRFDAGTGIAFLFFSVVLMVHRTRMLPSRADAKDLAGRLDQLADEAQQRIRDRAANRQAVTGSEIAEAVAVLEDIANRFPGPAFVLVMERVMAPIKAEPEAFGEMIRRGNPVRRWVYGATCNAAGDLVETGEFHIYRGALNSTGDELLRIFDSTADELVRLGATERDFVDRQKAGIRLRIKDVG